MTQFFIVFVFFEIRYTRYIYRKKPYIYATKINTNFIFYFVCTVFYQSFTPFNLKFKNEKSLDIFEFEFYILYFTGLQVTTYYVVNVEIVSKIPNTF